MPWLDFTLPDAMNKLGAVNVAYLFKPNMTGFYLTFRAFFYGELEAKYGKYLPLYLKNKSRHIREFLEESNKLRDDFVFSMDFSENTAVMKKHSAGTIIAKYYEKGNVPSDEELINDLNYFLELYQFVIDNYEDKTDLSVEEWVEVLENEEIIDEKMFSILNIMYNMDDYSATTGQISEKREEIGFDNEKSYNSIIISNSRRIKEFLNKKPIFNDDGTENYWTRFFYGKKVDGSFQFKLQDNLNEAFSRVDRINDSVVESESFDDININNEFEHKLEVEPMSKEENNYNSFYDYLTKNEYLFDKETIENYLLSLKVKPFAILTGNSGTGKTKLSQLFAKYIAELKINKLKNSQFSDSDDGYFTIRAKTNKSSWKNSGWTLPRENFYNILPFDEIEGKYDIDVDGIKAKCTLEILTQLFYDNDDLKGYFKELYDKNENGITELRIKKDDLKDIVSEDFIKESTINLKKTSGKSAYKENQWFLPKEFFDYLPFHFGYLPCNILVNGIHSTAKFRIMCRIRFERNNVLQDYLRENDGKEVNLVIKMDPINLENFKSKWVTDKKDFDEDENDILNNYKIIPVGANWTENRHIVGYYNVITNKYQSTPAYDLIKHAQRFSKPHFLILDEMNLSHVERYFADFLSAIESGEPIPLYGQNNLEIPSNLFIIGTVNVDETTYMFSPKVLDRANVLEFNPLSAEDYMLGSVDTDAPSGDVNYLENPLSDIGINDLNINDLHDIFKDVMVGDVKLWDILSDEIFNFQQILKKSGFDFGFRVINEIVRFMLVSWKYEGKPSNWTNWERYFDAQIKQKMLPKLHGSEKIIGETLDELYKECLRNPNFAFEETIKYPSSFKKIDEMRKILNKQRYMSFIN